MTTEYPRSKFGTIEMYFLRWSIKSNTKLEQKQRYFTIASLDTEGSFATGLFCLDKLPGFTIGPEFLLREGSDNDQPVGLTSSPPAKH